VACGAAALMVPTQQQCCMGTLSSTVLPVTTAPGECPCHVPWVSTCCHNVACPSAPLQPHVSEPQQVVLALLPASHPCSKGDCGPRHPTQELHMDPCA
jgi:hypothetical protein